MGRAVRRGAGIHNRNVSDAGGLQSHKMDFTYDDEADFLAQKTAKGFYPGLEEGDVYYDLTLGGLVVVDNLDGAAAAGTLTTSTVITPAEILAMDGTVPNSVVVVPNTDIDNVPILLGIDVERLAGGTVGYAGGNLVFRYLQGMGPINAEDIMVPFSMLTGTAPAGWSPGLTPGFPTTSVQPGVIIQSFGPPAAQIFVTADAPITLGDSSLRINAHYRFNSFNN